MESPEAHDTYSFYLNDATKGPLSREEAEALVKSGEIKPETPCAPGGASDWEAASKFFTFASNVPAAAAAPTVASASSAPSLKVSTNTVEKEEKTRPELEPRLRKRILQLGLATATTIDDFSETQALAAVQAYDDTQRKNRKTKWLGGIGAGVGVTLAAVLFGFTPPGKALNESIAGRFIKDSESYTTAQTGIASELNTINNIRSELKNTKLKEPEGGKEGEKFLTDRVRIPNSRQSLLRFKADFSKLAGITKTLPRAICFKQLPDNIKKQMLDQLELVWKYKHPDKLTDKLEDAELVASWELFRSETGDALATFVKTHEISRLELKDLSTEERSIEGKDPSKLVIAVDVKIKDDEATPFTIYFPYGKQELVPFSEAGEHRTTRDEMLEIEHYVVKEKKQLGGFPYGASVNFRGRSFFLERNAPPLYYLGVQQEEIKEGTIVWVRVKTEEEYNKAEVGTRLPTKQLFPYLCYTKPAEYRVSAPFSVKGKN